MQRYGIMVDYPNICSPFLFLFLCRGFLRCFLGRVCGSLLMLHDDGLGLCDVGLLFHKDPGGLEDLVAKIFRIVGIGTDELLNDETGLCALV